MQDKRKKRRGKKTNKAEKRQIYEHKIEIRLLEISKYISSAFIVRHMVRATSKKNWETAKKNAVENFIAYDENQEISLN